MTQLLADEVIRVAAEVAEIWSLLRDAASLGRVLPGCRELHEDAPDHYRGLLEARLAFITLRADVLATIAEADPPGSLRLDVSGRPKGLAGSFRAAIPVLLEATEPGTRVTYGVDLELSGRLATFGAPLLREVMRRQVAELVRNIEAEVGRGRASSGTT